MSDSPNMRLTKWLMACHEERAHPTYRDERFKQAAKELKRSWAENDALKNAIDSYRRLSLNAEGMRDTPRTDPRQSQPKCHSCGGWVKVEEGGICLPCHTEDSRDD
jgi:hypothetical protein